MATLSDYQVQYRRRLKRGLRRRAEAERKVRAYVRRLVEALDEVAAAGEVLSFLNDLYGVAVETVAPTEKVVQELVDAQTLRQRVADAPAADDLTIPFIKDVKRGRALPAEAVLGEWVGQVKNGQRIEADGSPETPKG